MQSIQAELIHCTIDLMKHSRLSKFFRVLCSFFPWIPWMCCRHYGWNGCIRSLINDLPTHFTTFASFPHNNSHSSSVPSLNLRIDCIIHTLSTLDYTLYILLRTPAGRTSLFQKDIHTTSYIRNCSFLSPSPPTLLLHCNLTTKTKQLCDNQSPCWA